VDGTDSLAPTTAAAGNNLKSDAENMNENMSVSVSTAASKDTEDGEVVNGINLKFQFVKKHNRIIRVHRILS